MLKHNLPTIGTLTRAAAGIAIIVALAIVARFFYRVSRIEAGWSTVAARWHTATLGRLTSASTVPLMEPPEQADFWLAEVDRIVSGPGDAARLAIGAACILDAPARGYLAAHLKPPELPGLPPKVDDTHHLEAIYESRCHVECLELAKRATDVDPTNVNWWRMRAMLTAARFLGGNAQEHAFRIAEWQTILDEAASHDPDNALYDYLAASRLWRTSSGYAMAPPTPTAKSTANRAIYLEIRDYKQFAAGVAKFNHGQQKKFVAFGEAGLPAIAEFVAHSRLTRGEQVDVATASRILLRSSGMAIDLFRWQMARADDCAAEGDPAEALALSRQCIHALSQIEATGETLVFDLTFAFIRRQALLRNLALSRAHPHLVNLADQHKLAVQLRGALLKHKLLLEAGKRANPPPGPPNVGDIAIHAVYASTPASVSLLLIVGLAAWLAGKWLGRSAGWQKPLPVWQHVMAWLVAYGIVFAVAGMAPAELIPANVQPWLAIGSIAGGLLFVGFLLWRARFHFTLRAVFILTFVCAALCVPLAALHQQRALDDFPKSLRMLPQGASVWDAAALNALLRIQPHSWLSATWQWFLRSGYFYSALVSPILVAFWWLIRRISRKKGDALSSSRAWWAVLLQDAGRSALALAAVLLLADLLFLPRLLEDAEATYQKRMLFFHDPTASYAVSRAALSAVKQDQATMDALRQATEEELESVLGSDAHSTDGGP